MTETIYARAPDVVWRLGPDRVLARRVAAPDGQAQDLQGAAALVWISLDEPGTTSDITERILGAGLEADTNGTDDTIRLLLVEQLVVVKQVDR